MSGRRSEVKADPQVNGQQPAVVVMTVAVPVRVGVPVVHVVAVVVPVAVADRGRRRGSKRKSGAGGEKAAGDQQSCTSHGMSFQ
jgi:hypothetical protein